jgi:hypothetical protein
VASVSASTGNGSGVATPDPFTEVLIDRMEANGFQVTQGYPVLTTINEVRSGIRNIFQVQNETHQARNPG